MPLALAQQLVRVNGAQQWLVLLDDTDKTDAKLAELGKVLPAANFELVPWYRLSDFYNKTRDLFASQVNVVQFIILMIIVLSISNTLSMSVMERVSEIGTCMSKPACAAATARCRRKSTASSSIAFPTVCTRPSAARLAI